MPKLAISPKVEGEDFEATELNQIVEAVNEVDLEAKKASHAFFDQHFIEDGTQDVGGIPVKIIKINPSVFDNIASPETRETLLAKLLIIPEENLPPSYWNNVTGDGSQNNPYTPGGGDIASWHKSLPGYVEGTEKILYGGITFRWGDIPTGIIPTKLSNPTLTLGTPGVDSILGSWLFVTDATLYQYQRDIDTNFQNPVTIYSGPAKVFTDSGLTASTTYFYRLRAMAPGFISSDYVIQSATTTATGITTPAAPTNPLVNDVADTFDWTNNPSFTSLTDYEQTLDFGNTYQTLTAKPLIIGNVAKDPGQVGVRIKAISGTRNASATLFNPTGYTVAAIKAPTPTGPITDDTANTFDWTYSVGFTDFSKYEFTLNGGTTYADCTSKPIIVGDVNKAIGQVGVRVKAATSVIASDTLFNTTAFTGTDGLAAYSLYRTLYHLSMDSVVPNTIVYATSADYGASVSQWKIPAGQPFILQIDYSLSKNGGLFGVSPTTDIGGTNSFNAAVSWKRISDTNGRFTGTSNGQGQDDYTNKPFTGTPKGRVRGTGTRIYIETSINNDGVWTEIDSTVNIPQPNVDLYAKAFMDLNDSTVNNVRQSGMVLA